MVRPVPSNPSSTNRLNDGSDDDDLLDDEAAGPSMSPHDLDESNFGRSSAEVMQERLGPGISLRTPPDEPLTAQDGSLLYRGFLAEQFRIQNLSEPADILFRESSYYRQPEATSAELVRAGERLRELSNEFAKSPMRQWVAQRAAQVSLETLDFTAFSDLLYGLFQEGGVTWERVVVLFYFCSDLAVRAFRERLPQQFRNIVDWSFRFISGESMLRWVTENGGWANVVQKSVDYAYTLTRIGFFVMGIVAFAAYLYSLPKSK